LTNLFLKALPRFCQCWYNQWYFRICGWFHGNLVAKNRFDSLSLCWPHAQFGWLWREHLTRKWSILHCNVIPYDQLGITQFLH